MTDNKRFMASMTAFIDQSKQAHQALPQVLGMKILARLVTMSPVGNADTWQGKAPPGYTGGRFRGNWQVTFDVPAETETGRIDPRGNLTLTEGIQQLTQFTPGTQAIYFSNTVPYAYRLEFGHSKQAPNGMVRVTAEAFQTLFNQAVKEMSTGRIMALLEHHLGTWAAKKGVPVASQNVQFSDTGGLYLQSHLLPATTECLDLAQVSRIYHGVYQITLCAPMGSGQAQVQAIADDLISLFDLGTTLTDGLIRCVIISVPTVFAGITHCHTYSLPLSLRYRAHVI